MKLEHNGNSFEFFDDINELPISQFHLYSKYCLVQNGIGDSLESVDRHIDRLVAFIKTDKDKAIAELMNYRSCLYSVANLSDYRNKAFLCLIRSVNGERWTDYTDEGINRLYGLILDVSEREMATLEFELCRKIEDALISYFPKMFASSVEKNYNELLYRRAMLQLSEIIDGADHEDSIKSLDVQIRTWYDPKVFEGKEDAEVEFDKQFERMCLAISKEYGGSAKNYSVMEFYTAQEDMRERVEEMKKIRKK